MGNRVGKIAVLLLSLILAIFTRMFISHKVVENKMENSKNNIILKCEGETYRVAGKENISIEDYRTLLINSKLDESNEYNSVTLILANS